MARIGAQDMGAAVAKKAKVSGGRLNRSETVSVRLDPKLNYLCELAARAQRRSKSSFVEWAIENSLANVIVPGTAESFADDNRSIAALAEQLWDTDEPDRLVLLAFNAPSLMTHEEQVIWKLVRENGFLWKGSYENKPEGQWIWRVQPIFLNKERLRDHWEAFVDVATGEKDTTALPTWPKINPEPPDPDEIPF